LTEIIQKKLVKRLLVGFADWIAWDTVWNYFNYTANVSC